MKVYTEEDFLLEDNEVEHKAAISAHAATTAGTFSLRRAYYLTETGKLLLSADQQRALTNLLRDVDPGTKKKIIAQNLRLVVSLAKRYTNRGLGLLDLVRVGNHGLIHALQKFESYGGFRFSIYATWCVCQFIECAIMNQSSPRHPARSMQPPVATFNQVAHGGLDVHTA